MSMVEYCHKAPLLCAGLYSTKTKRYTQVTSSVELEDYLNKHLPDALCAHNGAFDFLWMAVNLALEDYSQCSFYDTLQMCQYLCHEQAFSLSLDNVANTMFEDAKTADVVSLTNGYLQWYDIPNETQKLLTTYTQQDVKLLKNMFRVLYPQVPKVHLQLINWAIKAFIFPQLTVNQEDVDSIIYEKEKERTEFQLEFNAKPVQFSSAKQFSELYLNITKESVGTKESPSNPFTQIPALAKGDDFVLTTLHDKTDKGHESIKARLIKARLAHTANLELSRAKTWRNIKEGALTDKYYMHVAASGTFTNRPAGRNGGHGNPLNLSRGGKLRYALRPIQPHNNILIGFDFSSLELRIARWVANDKPAIDTILNGGDLYAGTHADIISRYASKRTHLVTLTQDHCFTLGNGVWSKVGTQLEGQQVPFNQTLNSEERFIGKTTSLSCVLPTSLVYTKRGWIPIIEVRADDLLWDGVEWVSHGGVIYQGQRETITFDGIGVTPDHKFYTDTGPIPIGECHGGIQFLNAQINQADAIRQKSVQQPQRPRLLAIRRAWDSIQVRLSNYGCDIFIRTLQCSGLRSLADRPHRQRRALRAGQPAVSYLRTERPQYGPQSLGEHTGWSNSDVGHTLLRQATRLISYAKHGAQCITKQLHRLVGYEKILGVHSGTYQTPWSEEPHAHIPDQPQGHSHRRHVSSSAVQTSKGTVLAQNIPNLSPQTRQTNAGTGGCSMGASKKLQQISCNKDTPSRQVNSTELFPVYDILNAGPRNRFVVKGDSTEYVISNCQYGVGHAKLRQALAQAGIKISAEEAFSIVHNFRSEVHPALPKAWSYTEDFMEDRSRPRRLNLPGDPTEHGWKWPSERQMFYYDLKHHRHHMDMGWTWCPGYAFGVKHRRRTYPSAVFQSLIQSLASEIMTDVHLRLIAEKFQVVQQIYDEITIIVDRSELADSMVEIRKIAEAPLTWWPDAPPLEVDIKHGDSYGAIHSPLIATIIGVGYAIVSALSSIPSV